jgi:hypothetical protein
MLRDKHFKTSSARNCVSHDIEEKEGDKEVKCKKVELSLPPVKGK